MTICVIWSPWFPSPVDHFGGIVTAMIFLHVFFKFVSSESKYWIVLTQEILLVCVRMGKEEITFSCIDNY